MTENQTKKTYLKSGMTSNHQESMLKTGTNNLNRAEGLADLPVKHEATLMFSGGIDSLLSAVLLPKNAINRSAFQAGSSTGAGTCSELP